MAESNTFRASNVFVVSICLSVCVSVWAIYFERVDLFIFGIVVHLDQYRLSMGIKVLGLRSRSFIVKCYLATCTSVLIRYCALL